MVISAWKLENAVQPVRVACEVVFQLLHSETGASIHVVRVIAAVVLFCILSSACEMSQMEYGHTGNFLLFVGVTEFSGGVRCCVETREHSAARHCAEFPSIYHEGRRPRGCGWRLLIKVQFWINRVASNIVFQPLGSGHWRTVARGSVRLQCDRN